MKNKLPNIVIFNPDQWRGDVLGHLDDPAAVTPNLDQIVAEDAVSFDAAFCQNPVCTPSRCSFMTGLYPHVRGHRSMNHMLHLEHGETNLLKVLKDHGYFIWWGGKNDLVPGTEDPSAYCDIKFKPTAADYKRWQSMPRPSTHSDTGWRGEPDGDNYYSFFAGLLDKGDDQYYCDSDWANVLGALDFIDNYDSEQPFCIFLPLQYPHPPYAVEEPFYSMIDRENLPEAFPIPKVNSNEPELLAGIRERQQMQGWNKERWRELRAVYYGMCARSDHQFGMIADHLKQHNIYDDSAIFFFSDHGDFTGDYGLVEKSQNSFADCLSRVPFIIKPPAGVNVKPGVNNALVELVDFSATVYELLDIDPGYDHFGRSLLPLIAGDTTEHRDAVFCEGGRRYGESQVTESLFLKNQPDGLYVPRIGLEVRDDRPYNGKAAMCRTHDFKYVMRLYETDELYNLKNDQNETVNEIDNPEYSAVLAQLKSRLLTWYMETCDTVPRQQDVR
jgi:arylsulfatase A-like enzyme